MTFVKWFRRVRVKHTGTSSDPSRDEAGPIPVDSDVAGRHADEPKRPSANSLPLSYSDGVVDLDLTGLPEATGESKALAASSAGADGTSRRDGRQRCASPVSADWMAAPTLAEAGTQFSVVGTSHHQEVIEEVVGPWHRDRPVTDLVTAQLAIVTEGPYAGAVGVFLAGDRIGSIPQQASDEYREVVRELTTAGRPATCRAAIIGGHYSPEDGILRNVGVALLQPGRPRPAPADAPFLPPAVGMRVVVPKETAFRLDAALPSRAKSHVRRCTGVLTMDGWLLAVDGEVIGVVDPSDATSLQLVAAAALAGFPLTCSVRMIREPRGPVLRIAVDLPIGRSTS